MACNGSNNVSGDLTELVALQYRSSEDWNRWIPADDSKCHTVIITLYRVYDMFSII